MEAERQLTAEDRARAILGDKDCWPHEAADYDELAGKITDALGLASQNERSACAAIVDPPPTASDMLRSALRSRAAKIRARGQASSTNGK